MPESRFSLPPRYELPELIAHGGMGDVFRATDTALERTVAIKMLAERYAGDDEFRTRFTREARTAARLSGEPNVIRIYDVGESEGLPYIVMEYVSGGSIATRLRAGPVDPGQALAWLQQGARALDAAHARGIVHRDVKPGNLLVGEDGEIRVTDFGIARATGHETLTGIGTILGTSGYMSPEQARGQRATAASDRYALGCVAFELLTGGRPFAGETAAVEAAAHATAPVPSAHDANPDLPHTVDAVFARGLAKEPADRHASCVDLVDDLRRAFHESATETRRLTTTAATAGAAPAPAGTRVFRASRSRRRWAAVAAGLAALAAAGIALGLALTLGDGELPRTVVLTETQTKTVQGEDAQTVTVEAAPESPGQAGGDGASLNDEGFRLLQERDFEGALPLLEQAVSRLQGSGELVEAWASYNLAVTRFALGQCDGVVELLDRSEEVQGERKEIDRLRRQVEKHCDEG
ncbi:MAG TPA: serine/threonine-protein kinase [Gaiella sp.]|jgi:serine/threonine-protein kinase